MKRTTFASTWITCSLFATLAAIGCVAGKDDSGGGGGGDLDGQADFPDGGDGGGDFEDGGSDFTDDGDSTGSPDGRDLPVREPVCDASGENCTCLQLAVFGDFKSGAKNASVQPFLDWLNGSADGTATMTAVSAKPTLTDDYLKQFDIILVANVNTWAPFSDEEKAAVEKWVRELGGGIIAISGFESTAAEATSSSQLTSFAGVSFTNPMTADDTGSAAQNAPVYYQNGTANLKQCLHWSMAEQEGNPQITAPVKFIPQTEPLDKLTSNLNYVGAYYGWTVTTPAGSTVVANDPVGTGTAMAVAHEVDGKGRIFAFGDEWVAFANQWAPTTGSVPDNQTQDANNPCWLPPAGDEAGRFHSVQTLYQTKQFWYNVINWVAPPNLCNFVVTDPDVVN